jgi:MFS family permease
MNRLCQAVQNFCAEAEFEFNDRAGEARATAHAAESFADRGILGRMDRLDARRDGFIHLRARAHARADRAVAAFRLCRDNDVGLAGSILFALFLVGWGLSFIWGPIADRFGRTKVLAATIFTFAIFTGLSAAAQNVWELASFRFIAGVGIGGEWALAGTYVAEAWPEDRRKMGAGYLQTGYYAGFFLAAALNYTIRSRSILRAWR